MEKFPLISVIIPAYNAAEYIEESINSILQQDYPNIEIIVVDDRSTDDTAKIAKRLKVRYIYIEKKSLPATMNIGFMAAKGNFIASLDADDLWRPNKLSAQMALF